MLVTLCPSVAKFPTPDPGVIVIWQAVDAKLPSAFKVDTLSGTGTVPAPALERALLPEDSADWAADWQSCPKLEGRFEKDWQVMALFWTLMGEMEGRLLTLPPLDEVEPKPSTVTPFCDEPGAEPAS